MTNDEFVLFFEATERHNPNGYYFQLMGFFLTLGNLDLLGTPDDWT